MKFHENESSKTTEHTRKQGSLDNNQLKQLTSRLTRTLDKILIADWEKLKRKLVNYEKKIWKKKVIQNIKRRKIGTNYKRCRSHECSCQKV